MGLLDRLLLVKPSLFGKEAEREAEKLLKRNGYKIVERNYHCRAGEIDIVAKEGDILIFCEVKARRGKSFGSALESITPSKIKKLRLAADDYMTKKKLHGTDCRFDVVTIDMGEGDPSMELIRNAF